MFSSSKTSEEEEILESLTVNRVGSTRGRSFDFFTVAARRQQIYAAETVPAICEKFSIEYAIIGEGSQILTNQKRENSAFSPLIGQNLRPFGPDNSVLYI